jgi:hypothetical protein
LVNSLRRCLSLIVVSRLELSRWHHADLAVQPAVVEPVEVAHRGELDVVDAPPRALLADELGLVEPVEALGESVVVAVAAAADRGDESSLGESLGVTDGQVLPRSLWCTRPERSELRRVNTAISRASRARARSVLSDSETCQPTTKRENTSMTKAT